MCNVVWTYAVLHVTGSIILFDKQFTLNEFNGYNSYKYYIVLCNKNNRRYDTYCCKV